MSELSNAKTPSGTKGRAAPTQGQGMNQVEITIILTLHSNAK
jgi:hypothetical protein